MVTTEIQERIIALYESGLGRNQIAQKLGLSRRTISVRLSRSGVSMRNPYSACFDKKQLVGEMYACGVSRRQIARDLCISRPSVSKYLRLLGYQTVQAVRYTIDENYFDLIDTADKAYWLGFILADGNIIKYKDGTFVLRVRLQKRDLNHLKLFATRIGYNGPVDIKKRFDKFYGKVTEKASITICCSHLCRTLVQTGWFDFKKFGVTHIMEMVPQHFQVHLIRGLFDGDGCLSLIRSKRHKSLQARFSFVDMHKSVVCWMQNWLICELGLNRTSIQSVKGSFVFLYGGNDQVWRIMARIYELPGCKLQRKYEKWRLMEVRDAVAA